MSHHDQIRISLGDVIDDFEILEVLATGGSSTTFRATHRTLARDVAFKFVHPAVFSDDTAAIDVARADAIRVARLEHPAIAPVFAAGTHRDGLYIASAITKGRTLAAAGVARDLAPTDAVRVLCDIASALEEAHVRGVVHRDLRPDCITIDRWGHGVLSDFGVTRVSGRTGLLTRAEILESLRYTAPEIVLGEPATSASDVYSLAAVAVWCLTGGPPYRDRPTAEYLHFRTTAPAPVLTTPDGGAVSAVNAALGAAMALQPQARPMPAAFAHALAAAVAELPVQLRAAGTPLTGSEVPSTPPEAREASPTPAVAHDATRVEHRRPLPPATAGGPVNTPWGTYAACAMAAITVGLGGLLAGRADAPKPAPPTRVGSFTLDLDKTWRRLAPTGSRAAGDVHLRGPRGETATVGLSDAIRLPGDPLPAELLPEASTSPSAATGANVPLVRYRAARALLVARPTTKGVLFARCSPRTPVAACAALVALAKGEGRNLRVLPIASVSETLQRVMRSINNASALASVAFGGKRGQHAAAAQRLAADLEGAAADLDGGRVDRGTATELQHMRDALGDEVGAFEALPDAIDRQSDSEFRSALRRARASRHRLTVILEEFRRAGYQVTA